MYGDDTKPRWPKQVAQALQQRSSLRTAIRLWGVARSCYGFSDCTAHPTRKEETGGTTLLNSPSQIPQLHRRNSAHKKQSAEIAFLTSPSQLLQFNFVVRPNVGRSVRAWLFMDGGVSQRSRARERRQKTDCFSSTLAAIGI